MEQRSISEAKLKILSPETHNFVAREAKKFNDSIPRTINHSPMNADPMKSIAN